jgi:hypothetical protein
MCLARVGPDRGRALMEFDIAAACLSMENGSGCFIQSLNYLTMRKVTVIRRCHAGDFMPAEYSPGIGRHVGGRRLGDSLL